MNLNKVKAVLASIAVASSLLLPITYNSYSSNQAYKAAGATVEEGEEVTAYMIQSPYADAVAKYGSNGSSDPYYVLSDNSYVNGSKEESRKSKLPSWKTTYKPASISIPKKVGGYEVIGVEKVEALNNTTGVPMLNNAKITLEHLKQYGGYSGKVYKEGPFYVNNQPAIVVSTVQDDSMNSTGKFDYQATSFSVSYIYNESSRSLAATITTNWKAKQTDDNKEGETWTNETGFAQMMEDAKTIWMGIDPAKVMNKTGVAKADQARARKPYPESDVQGKYSKANNFGDWKAYWQDYYKGGGSATISSTDVWYKLWNGTYDLKDDEGKQQFGNTLRIYNPYIIKLKLKQKEKKQTDLELVGSPGSTNSNLTKGKCTAEYRKGYLYVKVVGNAVSLENPSTPPNSGVSIEMSSTANHINQLKGTISPQKLEKDKPVNYAEAGSSISPTSSSIEGSISTEGPYFKIPIKQTESGQPQKVKIKLFINPTKSPTESTYDNNPWEADVDIPAEIPDLIAHKITHSYSGNKVGSSAKVNLQLVTKDKGFENLQSYVASHKDTKVIYKVWIDGSTVKNENYTHEFLKGTVLKNVTFQTPTFTESKLEYRVKVLLHINPDRNLPTKEETFTNNKLEIEFIIRASVPKPPPAPDPEYPKFTRSEDCVFLDKNSPKTNSVILYNMGTYQQVHNISNPKETKWPTNSEIYWNSVKTSVPLGMNWGQMQEGSWEAVYPEYGKNGWGTLSPPDTTGGCSYCEYDAGAVWYKEYTDFLNDYKCKATFKYWDTDKFQQSKGSNKTEIKNGSCYNLRMNYREVGNKKICEGNCCDGDTTINGCPYNSRSLHGHHTDTYTVSVSCSSSCSESCSGGHTETRTHRQCEVGSSKCSVCGGGPYGKNPKHCHSHGEYRLEYLTYVTLTFNVKIYDNPTVKVVDYGSGQKITRAGYGISTQIQEVDYATDYKNSGVAPHQYGDYPIKPFASKSIVKTPANNERPKKAGGNGVYLISRLEQKGGAEPFAKKFINVPNKKAEQKGLNGFKEVYTDVDYPNGDLPVLFQVYYQPLNFQPPRKKEWMTPKERQLTEQYGNKLKKGLGVCAEDKIAIKGNIWDDAWTHPTRPTS